MWSTFFWALAVAWTAGLLWGTVLMARAWLGQQSGSVQGIVTCISCKRLVRSNRAGDQLDRHVCGATRSIHADQSMSRSFWEHNGACAEYENAPPVT